MTKEEAVLIITEQDKSTKEILKTIEKLRLDFGKLQNELEEEQRKNNKLEALLIKAKELIKRLMHELVVSNTPYDEVKLLVEDVEQFLKE